MAKSNLTSMNIIDFIGHQEQNLIGGIINLKAELGFMTTLDDNYQYLMSWYKPSTKTDMLVNALYLDVHKSYYLAMLNFLRNNFSVSMMSARKAIESVLTAYHLCIHPEDEPVFYDRKHERYKIFYNIKKHVKENADKYPFTDGLVKTHELASRWASHATVEALLHKLELVKPEDTPSNIGELRLHYSEILKFPDEYLSYYFFLIYVFSMAHSVFWKEFFQKQFRIANLPYERGLESFKDNLNKMAQKYPVEMPE